MQWYDASEIKSNPEKISETIYTNILYGDQVSFNGSEIAFF